MASKKALALFIFISLGLHMLALFFTGFIGAGKARAHTDVITVDIKPEAAPEPESSKTSHQETAQPAEAAPGKTPVLEEKTVDLGSEKTLYGPYLKNVKSRIEKAWNYPREAYENGLEGTTTVFFSVDREGKLVECRILASSGHQALDKCILELVKAASPYERLPAHMNLSKLNIVASFQHSLRD